MEPMRATQRWLGQAADNRNFAYALLAGLALETAALILLLPLVNQPVKPAQTPGPMRLTIAAPPTPKPPAPPVSKPPPPLPPVAKPPPPLPKPPPPMPQAPPPEARPVPRPVTHPLRHLAPPPPRPLPVQPPAPPVPAAPAAPPPPAPPSAGQVDLFRDAVRRAVQEVANSVYPQGAQESGTVEITISYLNGRALDVTLARSSGFPLLDAAALQAGRIAPYPAPPPAFANHVYPWTITVIFQAAAPSVDSD
jgi:protein TonB